MKRAILIALDANNLNIDVYLLLVVPCFINICLSLYSLTLINLVKDIFHIFEMIIVLAFKHLNWFICVIHTHSCQMKHFHYLHSIERSELCVTLLAVRRIRWVNDYAEFHVDYARFHFADVNLKYSIHSNQYTSAHELSIDIVCFVYFFFVRMRKRHTILIQFLK